MTIETDTAPRVAPTIAPDAPDISSELKYLILDTSAASGRQSGGAILYALAACLVVLLITLAVWV